MKFEELQGKRVVFSGECVPLSVRTKVWQAGALIGITVDKEARAYVPRLFGANGFAVIGRPSKLLEALPVLYRHVVGA